MPTPEPARLLIVERQPAATSEVRTRLGREPGFAVVGRVGSAVEATRVGGHAYLRASTDPDVFVATLRRALAGDFPIDEEVVRYPAVAALFVKLWPREIEIVDQVARGNSNKLIARKLGISDQTVKNHVSAILRKLEVNDRTEAVVYALRNGWIRIDTPVS